MRVACPCSTEAQRSNPSDFVCQTINLVVLSDSHRFANKGDADRVADSATRHVSKSVSHSLRRATNPPTGFGPPLADRSTCARVGSFLVATHGTGEMTILGDRSKKPTANSSTTKGSKELAGQCSGRRRRNARSRIRSRTTTKRLWLSGKGGASFFCPLKWLAARTGAGGAESMPHWEVGHTANSLRDHTR